MLNEKLPSNARQFTKDVPMAVGFQLWGTATGKGVPLHRQWWITKSDGQVIGHLDQGCYSNSGSAAKSRRAWAMRLGAFGGKSVQPAK
jgi:hypothetical protein